MATYLWRCPECGLPGSSTDNTHAPDCYVEGAEMVRDYRSEGVGFSGLAEMARQREQGLDGLSGRKAQRDLFLPTARDFAKPGDRDGQKGMREWNERHGPRPTNKDPLYPDVDKKVF